MLFYYNMSQQVPDEMQQNNKISDSELNEEYHKGSHIILVSVLCAKAVNELECVVEKSYKYVFYACFNITICTNNLFFLHFEFSQHEFLCDILTRRLPTVLFESAVIIAHLPIKVHVNSNLKLFFDLSVVHCLSWPHFYDSGVMEIMYLLI